MARPLGPVPEHGTRQRYQLRGDPCDCTPCKRANRLYVSGRRIAARMMRASTSVAPKNPIAARNQAAWTQIQLPPEFMVKCGHSGMEDRERCAWCGDQLQRAS